LHTIVGIDEAGYSPLLGPLVISAAAFEAVEPPGDWWKALGIPKARAKPQTHLPAIDDSKKLYTPKDGVANLEKAVLSFLEIAGRRPASLRQLLSDVDACVDLDSHPWYRGADVAIPIAIDRDAIGRSSDSLCAAFDSARVRFLGFHSQPILEGDLNQRLDRCDNKATVLLTSTLGVVEEFLRPGGSVQFLIDKQGGRDFYGHAVSQMFFGCHIHHSTEGNDLSTYCVQHGDCHFDLSFCVRGDAAHLPIALASMLSKYIRELFMKLFNRYWQAIDPALPYTSGYRTDGWRFVRALDAAERLAGIERALMIRNK